MPIRCDYQQLYTMVLKRTLNTINTSASTHQPINSMKSQLKTQQKCLMNLKLAVSKINLKEKCKRIAKTLLKKNNKNSVGTIGYF